MILAYTRDATGAGDNFRIMNLFVMSAIETPKKILTSKVCLLCKANVSTEKKIKVFGKSTVAIHSMILHSTDREVCRSVRLWGRLKHDTFKCDMTYL